MTHPVWAGRRMARQLVEVRDRYRLHDNRELLRALEGLQKRSATEQLTLAVLSDSIESKAKLLEALLKINLKDTSIPVSTAACTYFAYGAETEAAVTLANGLTARLPLEQLEEFVAEKVSARNLHKILVRLPIAVLQNGLVIVDTPELTGSLDSLTQSAVAAVREVDVCVLVVSATAGLREELLPVLSSFQGNLGKFFFIVDTGEGLSEVERQQVLAKVTHTLQHRCGLENPPVSLLSFPPEVTDAAPWEARWEAVQSSVLEFARLHSRRSMAVELVRLAGETFSYAERVFNSKGPWFRHSRLRAGLKDLDGIRRNAEHLALVADEALRRPLEPGEGTTAGTALPRRIASAEHVASSNGAAAARRDEQAEQKERSGVATPVPVLVGTAAAIELAAMREAKLTAALRELPGGNNAESSLVEAPMAFNAAGTPPADEEMSDLPESVKAWYAMPVGPPTKPAKRSLLWRNRRVRTAESPAEGIAASAPALLASELEPGAVPVLEPAAATAGGSLAATTNETATTNEKEEFTRRSASSRMWRVAGLTAMAATAGAMMVTTWPQIGRAHSPRPGTSQLSNAHFELAKAAAAFPPSAKDEGIPVNLQKPSGMILEDVSTPVAEEVASPSGTTLMTADRDAAIESVGVQPYLPAAHSPVKSQGARIRLREHPAFRSATVQPCDRLPAGSQRASESLPKKQHQGVGAFLSSIRRHLTHLPGRQSRNG